MRKLGALVAAVGLLAAACGDDDAADPPTTDPTTTEPDGTEPDGTEPEPDPTDPADATDPDDGEHDGVMPAELRSDVEHVDPPADAPVDQLVAGSNAMGFDLQRELSADGNLVFSPASVMIALAMASAGAGDDETAAQLEEVFGFPGGEETHEALNALLAALEIANENVEPGNETELTIANSGWANQDVDIVDEFLDTLARHYGAGLFTADFGGDPEGSREAINRWVADETRDRIEELIGDGVLDAQTVYVLVNAIYLKASWAVPFNEDDTEPGEFTLADGSTVEVPMMHHTGMPYQYAETDDYVAVKLPYADRELAMRVVMPDGLAAFVDGLDADEWSALVGGFEDVHQIDLTLPKWETDSELDLNEPLSSLGLEVPGGDYSGIAPGAFLSEVLQAANITVDEQGTEAAAATAAVMAVSAPPPGPDLVFDQPFFYTIEHEPTGMILFAGQVHDPS